MESKSTQLKKNLQCNVNKELHKAAGTFRLNPTSLFTFPSPIKALVLMIVLIFSATVVQAADRYSVANGNWNSTAVWATADQGTPGASVPVAGDNVFITRGWTVTVNITNAACSALNLGRIGGTAAGSGTLTFAATGNPALVVSGAVMMGGTSTNASTGTITFTSGSSLTAGSLQLGNTNGPGVLTMTNGGSLTVNGQITLGAATKTWTPGTGTVIMTATNTLPATIFSSFNNLTINGGTTTTAANLTVNSNLTVGSGSTFTIGTNFTLGVTGTTTVSGTFFLAGTGTKTFTGDVTLNSGSVYNETGVAAINYAGNLQNNATTFIANSGVHTFSGAARILSGATTTAIANVAVTGTWTNNGLLTVGTALTGAGGLTNGATGVLDIGGTSTVTTLTATAVGNTINYSGGAQTLRVIDYHHLSLSGGAKTFGAITTVAGNLSLSGTTTATTAAVLAVGGNLDLGSGTTFATGLTNTWTLSVAGNTSVSGTLTLANTGAKNFNGNVTVNPTGVWSETGIAPVNYAGNLQNDGTYTTVTGMHTFSGTGKTISGNNAVVISDLTVSGTVTNNGTLTVSTTLAGAGTLTNGASGTLNFSGASITPTLIATAVGNTVNYNGAGQPVTALNYDNLTLSGSGTKTLSPGTVIAGNLRISNTVADLSGTANTANALYLGGAPKASGTWGATASNATNIDNTYFAGSGWVTVSLSLVPILSVTSGSLDHGASCVGVAAAPVTYTITNNGTAAAGITVVSNDGQFVVSELSSTTIAGSGGTATYKVTFTPGSSGAKSASITIASTTTGSNSPVSSLTGTGNEFPVVTYLTQPGAGPRCIGVDITYTTEDAKSNYAWVIPGTLGNDYSITSGGTSADNTVVLKYLTSGSKTVTVNYTSNGCTPASPVSSTATTVSSLPAAPAAITGVTDVCVGLTTTLASTTLGGAWTSSDITKATVDISTGVVTGVLAGTSTITYTVTNGSGCTNSVTQLVTVNALPAAPAAITGVTSVCVGLTTTLASTTPGGAWTSSDLTIATVDVSSGIVTGVLAGTSTISYTVTNGNGCSNSVTQLVTVNALPAAPAAITGISSVCVGSTTTLASTTPGGEWTSSDLTKATVDISTGVVTGVLAGTSTITYTVTNGSGCTNFVTQLVTVKALPTASITGTLTACVTTTLTAVSSAVSPQYVWYKDDIVINLQTASTLVVTASGNYKVKVNDASTGCENTSGASSVIVNALPSVSIGGTTTACGSTTLTAVTDASSPTITWYKDNVVISGETSLTLLVTESGNYKVVVKDGSTNCENNNSVPGVVIHPLPTATVTGTLTSCGTTTLTAVTDAASPEYVWYRNDVVITLETSSSLVVTTSGNYKVKVKDGTTLCENTSGASTVVINPLPSSTITGTLTACGTTTLTAVSDAASPSYIWYKDGGALTGQTASTLVASASGDYTVKVTNGLTSCFNTSAISAVTINALPTPIITGSATVCEGEASSVYSVTDVAGHTYSWTVVGGTVTFGAGTNEIIVTWDVAGPGTVDVTETITSSGCTADAPQKAVTVNASPAPVITGSATVCAGATGSVYSVTNVADHLYSWSVSGGLITSGAGTNSITVTWGSAGVGSIDVTEAVIATSCSAAATQKAVSIVALPTPVITGSNLTCALSGGSVYSVTDVAGHDYAWTVTGGAITDGAGTNSITVAWGAAGAGTVNVTETISASGCWASALQKSVTINVLPAPVITGLSTVCAGVEGSVYSVALVAGRSYIWTVEGGLITAGDGTNSISVAWGSAGAGTVDITETISSSGCSADATQKTVTINPLPTVAAIGGGAASVCVNATTPAFTNATVGGNWSILDLSGTASINSGGVATGLTAGNVAVVYTVSGSGCENSTSKVLAVNALPVVEPITGTETVSVGSTTALACLTAGGVWSSGTPENAIVDASTGVVLGIKIGTSMISYTFTNGNGCSSTSTLLVTVTVATGIEDQKDNDGMTLRNYPNPFSANTTICYTLPSDGRVTLVIRNVAGQVVKTILNETETSGDYTLNVEVGDLQSGVYLATLSLKSNGKELLKTIRLVKGK